MKKRRSKLFATISLISALISSRAWARNDDTYVDGPPDICIDFSKLLRKITTSEITTYPKEIKDWALNVPAAASSFIYIFPDERGTPRQALVAPSTECDKGVSQPC